MKKKVLMVLICTMYSIVGSAWTKCLNLYHNTRRMAQGEETKKYTCLRQKTDKAAFDTNNACINCGCLKDFHDNDSSDRRDQ